MKLSSLEDVYYGHVRDLASTEKQLTQALAELAEAATDERLKELFETHKTETEEQYSKVEEILKNAGKSARGRKCKATEGLIEDGQRAITATGDETTKNAALAVVGRQSEHLEIFAYRAAIGLAEALGKNDDAETLREILRQEQASDEKLSGFLETSEPKVALDEDSRGVESATRSMLEREGALTGSSNERMGSMPRDYDDRYDNRGGGYEGRSRGGQRSAEMQDRDEYGRFTGYDDDRGGSSRGGYSSSRGGYSSGGGGRGRDYDDDDRGGRRYSGGGGGNENFGGYEGRSRGGQHSAEMQERDEYGRFMGYDDDRGGSSRGGYSSGGSRGGYSGGGGGGYGNGGGGSRGGYITDSAGRRYTEESWERAQEGRSRGGEHSRGGRGGYDDDDRGSSRGGYSSGSRGSSSRGGYDDDDDRGGSRGGYSGGGSRGGRGGDYVDSAGRHYTQESWERAQEGRSRGGQHSHRND